MPIACLTDVNTVSASPVIERVESLMQLLSPPKQPIAPIEIFRVHYLGM